VPGLPRDGILHLEASKTGKEAEWDMALSGRCHRRTPLNP
jgi:hypothetical protein